MTSHLSFNSMSPEVYLWFFPIRWESLISQGSIMCLKNSDFRLNGLAACFSRSKWLSPQGPSSLAFLISVCNSDRKMGRGQKLQSKLIVSTGLKRKLFSLLQRKDKLFFKHIKNHFSSVHFACMPPNYQVNYKLFWRTHWGTYEIFRRYSCLYRTDLGALQPSWGTCRELGILERQIASKKYLNDHCQMDFWIRVT